MKFAVSVVLAGLAATVAFAQVPLPEDFKAPTEYVLETYKLVPLGPDVAELDYKAYMSSIEHIRKTNGGNWPREDLAMDDQAKDMANEGHEWATLHSYPYAVLTLDGKTELGCFYLRPGGKQGYDVVATMWVTKEQFDKGFERTLEKDMRAWVAEAWPFGEGKVAWVGKDISREKWKEMPDK